MNKTAVITGASGGIGRALLDAFQDAGYRVLCGCNSHPERLPDGVWAMAADLSDPKQAAEFAEAVLREADGRVDVLINNAGIAQQKLFQDITDEDWAKMRGVNLDGVFYLTRALLPAMIRQQSGRIINISSMWGVVGASCEVHYSAAKAAVIGMTKALAKEVGPSGITVNCIAPGVIKTPMLDVFTPEDLQVLADETPMGRLGTGEDVAALALFLADEKAGFITGQTICADGGFSL